MKSASTFILMIRPWVTDFSAYDHFALPRGFLSLAAYLRSAGWNVHYLDCLRHRETGGQYVREEIEKPDILADIPRRYKRYGLSLEAFHNALNGLPTPRAILITTGMTYWYPGLIQTIEELRKHYPGIPMAAGGIYVTLCPDHARRSTGIQVFPGPVSATLIAWLQSITGISSKPCVLPETLPSPAWDMVPDTSYAVVTSSEGCRHQCSYCAATNIYPVFISRSQEDLTREITDILARKSITDIALYDDDFADPVHLTQFLKFLVHKQFPVKWHLPNALSIHAITPGIATLMKQSGFQQPRLSVNHIDRIMNNLGFSNSILDRFTFASECLLQAGYDPAHISAYILAGLPCQTLSGIECAAHQLSARSITPYFSQFSLIPGTPLGDQRLAELGYTATGELLLTNKLLSVYRHPGWTGQEYYDLNGTMRMVREETHPEHGKTDPPEK